MRAAIKRNDSHRKYSRLTIVRPKPALPWLLPLYMNTISQPPKEHLNEQSNSIRSMRLHMEFSATIWGGWGAMRSLIQKFGEHCGWIRCPVSSMPFWGSLICMLADMIKPSSNVRKHSNLTRIRLAPGAFSDGRNHASYGTR